MYNVSIHYTPKWWNQHYGDVTIMGIRASQITGSSSVCLTVCFGWHQRKYRSPRLYWRVDSPHKGPVTQKRFHLMTSSWVRAVSCLLWFSNVYLYQCTSLRLPHCQSNNPAENRKMNFINPPRPMIWPKEIWAGQTVDIIRWDKLNVCNPNNVTSCCYICRVEVNTSH